MKLQVYFATKQIHCCAKTLQRNAIN